MPRPLTRRELLDLPLLSDHASRNPQRASRAEHRPDPFYDGLWGAGSRAAWTSRQDVERLPAALRRRAAGAARSKLSVGEAIDAVVDGYRQDRRLRELAAVLMFRTLSVAQLAAVVGDAMLLSPRVKDLDLLWQTGLIATAEVVLGRGTRTVTPTLLQVVKTRAADTLLDRLTPGEWLNVTAAQPWTRGSQFDRHNLLTSEFLLRVAELTPAPLVLGEHLAALPLIAPREAGVPATSKQVADGVIIRADGMRIAVEMTTSGSTANVRAKVERWAHVLAEDPTKTLAVLFVVAPHPDRSESRGDVLAELRKTVATAANAGGARVLSEVPERMLVGSWEDWFPAAGYCIEGFPQLPAWRPTATGSTARWEPVDVLDEQQLIYRHPIPEARSVIANSGLLAGIPHWLRRADVPDLLAVDFERVGRPDWVRADLEQVTRDPIRFRNFVCPL